MKLEPLIIAIILFGGVMLGMGTFYADVQTTYSPANSTAAGNFTRFNQTSVAMNATMGNLMQHSTSFASKSFLDLSKYSDVALMFVDVAAVLLQLPGHIVAFFGLVFDMTPLGLVPDWFKLMVGLIIVVLFALKVASIVMRSEAI